MASAGISNRPAQFEDHPGKAEDIATPPVNLQSTLLHAAVYHSQSDLLELEFRSGALQRYFAVPAQSYQELLSAESPGGYFNHHIRNCFAYTQVRPVALTSNPRN